MKKITILSIVCLVSGTIFAQTNAASSLPQSKANAVKAETEMKAAAVDQKAVKAPKHAKKMNAASNKVSTTVEPVPVKEATDNVKPTAAATTKQDQ